jgi:23S rRNA (uracil1939-C5)-methyltransferase
MRRRSVQTRKRKSEPAGSLPIDTRFDGRVRDIGADGRGIVPHENGQVFFVAGVWLNEQVQVRITEFKGRFGFAELVSVIEPSPDRVEPPCPYQGVDTRSCGGCPWQFVSYEAQLHAKQARVEQTFARMIASGLLKSDRLKLILPSPDIYGYRNRAQLKSDGESLGYMAAGSRTLVDVADCLILTEKNRQTLQALRQKLPNFVWRPRRKDHLTTLDIDESVDADSASVNARLPFRQANSAQNRVLHLWLTEKLSKLDKSRPLLELFAGSGNFTGLMVAAGFDNIVAVEVVDEAMAELREHYPQVKTLACDLFSSDAAEQLHRAVPDAEVLVLDPPRDGLKNDVLKSKQGLFRKRSKLKNAFYISCNLATLHRDLQPFVEHGFKIREIQPLDQFPHTPHIELMAHLERL